MPQDRVARRVRVRGRVQGVAFRAWTQNRAEELGLSGWVRNEPDGSVSALLAGPAPTVERMVALLRQGPVLARVDGVEEEEAAMPDGEAFEIRA